MEFCTQELINKIKESSTNLLVVCGPTASGKTSLGVNLAIKLDGEIISADSRQVYQGMDIGTGKDLEEYSKLGKNISYHLIDIVSPKEIYTLYNYIEDFYQVFQEISARGKFPIAVGGTGLYLEAVLKHYQVPNIPENFKLREELMQKPQEELIKQLEKYPDIIKKTDLSSKKRIVRSLEVADYSKEHKIEWGGGNAPDFRPLIIAVCWPREELITRIDLRLENRLKAGMVEEVEQLLTAGVTKERMLLFGMEYKYLTMYLLKEISYQEMFDSLKTAIHRLAKRQMTWFRGMEKRGLDVYWIERCDLRGLHL